MGIQTLKAIAGENGHGNLQFFIFIRNSKYYLKQIDKFLLFGSYWKICR